MRDIVMCTLPEENSRLQPRRFREFRNCMRNDIENYCLWSDSKASWECKKA